MADLQKKNKQFRPADNPVEQLKDEVLQVPKAILEEGLAQLGLKPQRAPMSGEIDLVKKTEKVNSSVDLKIKQLQTIASNEKMVFSAKQRQTETQIRQLLVSLSQEVKALQSQTAELSGDVKKMTVESIPVNPGLYHVNFLEFVIGTLKDLRKKVNESRIWLNMSFKKKQQKGYWAMYKKHGNKFAMSDERAVASAGG